MGVECEFAKSFAGAFPAAWGALVPGDRGTASQGILGDLGAVGSEPLPRDFLFALELEKRQF